MDSIIFDVDGTIWDSTQSVADSWNKAIREHSDLDLTLDPVSLSRVFGKRHRSENEASRRMLR